MSDVAEGCGAYTYIELNKLILRTFCSGVVQAGRQSKSQTLFCIIYGQVISVFKTVATKKGGEGTASG